MEERNWERHHSLLGKGMESKGSFGSWNHPFWVAKTAANPGRGALVNLPHRTGQPPSSICTMGTPAEASQTFASCGTPPFVGRGDYLNKVTVEVMERLVEHDEYGKMRKQQEKRLSEEWRRIQGANLCQSPSSVCLYLPQVSTILRLTRLFGTEPHTCAL